MVLALGAYAGVAAALVAVICASGAVPAHATPPAMPCDFECKWPAGSYDIPDAIEAGKTAEITYSYTWDGVGGSAAPDGYYAIPDELADAPPPGYAGSTVTLRLPHEITIVGWADAGFERERLWTDHYGRTMYEYTSTNAYAADGVQSRTISLRLAEEGAFYPVTEIMIDLGLSVANGPPAVWWAERSGGGTSLSPERPEPAGASGVAGAAGASAAADEYPHRQSLRWPVAEVEAIGGGDIPGGAAGAAGDDETYVYGYLQYRDRYGHAKAAAGVRACLYDVGATADDLALLSRGGADACTQTGASGFYGIPVDRADPAGDGDADIVVRFTTQSSGVTVTTGIGEEAYLYDLAAPTGPLGATLSMGRATVPDAVPFRHALVVHVPILEAREYFAEEFAYEVPHVPVWRTDSNGLYARGLAIRLEISPDIYRSYRDWVALHEYGHHIMHSANGIPFTTACSPHYFPSASSDTCAWSEGWANFVPHLVAQSAVFPFSEDRWFDLEGPRDLGLAGTPVEFGSAVESRVSAILWDIHDGGADESLDGIHGKTQLLWDAFFDEPEPGEEIPASSIHDFVDDWDDAGYPDLGEVLLQNEVRVTGGASTHVQGPSGAPKAGYTAVAGDSVRVTVNTAGGAAPMISFHGGAETPMSPGGAAGSWIADYAVSSSSPDGPVIFVASSGADTVATAHDVNPRALASVDRTPPGAPSAEFVAPDEIRLTFPEPLAPLGGAAFSVEPPSGEAPSVSASLDDSGLGATQRRFMGERTVLLSLSPQASVDGEWIVTVPGSLTDKAGNAYAGGAVTADFAADSEAPTFTARRIADTEIAVEFNEDVRLSGIQTHVDRGAFTLSPNGEGTDLVSHLGTLDQANRRVMVAFSQSVVAGTLTFHTTDDRSFSYIEDRLGNRLADGASATVAAEIVPAFRARPNPGFDPDVRIPAVAVEWRGGVSGITHVSEWQVNGQRPLGFGMDYPGAQSYNEGSDGSRALPGIFLYMDELTCVDGRVQVEYTRPTGDGANAITQLVTTGDRVTPSAPTPSMGASTECAAQDSDGARFLDERTVSLALSEPPAVPVSSFGVQGSARLPNCEFCVAPPVSVSSFGVQGLGPAIAVHEPGSKTVKLHTRNAATPGETYVVSGDLIGRFTVQNLAVPVPIESSATYMDTEPPTVRRADIIRGSSSFDAHVRLYMSEPLDKSTFDGKEFTTAGTLGSLTALYAAGDQAIVLVPSTRLGANSQGPHTITIPSGITDVNGMALTSQVVTAKLQRTYNADNPVFTGARTLTYRANAMLDDESLSTITIEPGLGSIVPSQSPNPLFSRQFPVAVTLATEHHARHNTEYTISVPHTDADGVRPVEERYLLTRSATYLDTTPPAVSGARFASPDTIEVSLSEPLDPATVAGAAFAVSPPLGTLDVSYTEGGATIMIISAEAARQGVAHTLSVPGTMRDYAGLAAPAVAAMPVSAGALLRGASFTAPDALALEASGPLDASTLGGIEVSGLGRVAASYDEASLTVGLRTARAAEEGGTHAVSVPPTVLDASGAAVGPQLLEATHAPADAAPAALGAATAAHGWISVTFDRDVGPAGGSPGSLDAARWAVGPAGGTGAAALSAVAVGDTVWLGHAAAAASLAVAYAPAGGAGDVADRVDQSLQTGAFSLPVEDRIPPSLSATTASRTATVVTFDRAMSGTTWATEWTVGGEPALGVSALAGAGTPPASGAAMASLPAGTTRIALHHGALPADAAPEVAYSQTSPETAGIAAGQARLGAVSVVASDGVAPSVLAAAFASPQTLHVELNEPPGGAVGVASFSVSGPGGAVAVTGASAAPHSATVTLALGADAATGAHTVTAAASLADAAGNRVAPSASSAPATYAPPAPGAPSLSARTSSPGSTVVTFEPAVSGTTSAASWIVSGSPATAITHVGGAAVPGPGANPVTLPAGTTSITLSHAPLHGTTAEPVVRHAGSGVTAGGAELGAQAAKAADGVAPQVVSAITVPDSRGVPIGSGYTRSSTATHVGFSEPVSFVGDDVSAQPLHWHRHGVRGVVEQVDEVTILVTDHVPQSTTEQTPWISYVGTIPSHGAEGSVMDASGNALEDFDRRPTSDRVPPNWADPYATLGANQFSENVSVVEGALPVFVITSEDGTRVGIPTMTSISRSVIIINIEPPMFRGIEYVMAAPPIVDDAGNAYGGDTWTGTIGVDDSPPAVETARFDGARTVRVTFDEALLAIPASAAFRVSTAGGAANLLAPGGVSHEAGLDTVTLSLASDASPGAHDVHVPATVEDLADNAYATAGTPVPATYDTVAPRATAASFSGDRAVSVALSEALDPATAGHVTVGGLGPTSVSYVPGASGLTVYTRDAAAAGSSYRVSIPAAVTDASGVAFEPATLHAARSDAAAPSIIAARTVARDATEVDLDEAVRFGPSPTAQQHAAHWTVMEGQDERAVTGAAIVRGGLTVRLSHEALAGGGAMPTVAYEIGADDDARVRDWGAPSPLATTAAVSAADGLPPAVSSLTVSASRAGDGPGILRAHARGGDTVTVAVTLGEDAGATAPTIRIGGTAETMAQSGQGRASWTHAHTVVGADAQGPFAFLISAADAGGNVAYSGPQDITSGTNAVVDTVAPTFSAETTGETTTVVTFSEPVSGVALAADWTVGGAEAAPVGGTLDGDTSLTLTHAAIDTDARPAVVYAGVGGASGAGGLSDSSGNGVTPAPQQGR